MSIFGCLWLLVAVFGCLCLVFYDSVKSEQVFHERMF
nr:MAG TPA: hypothetical protein [Caudoviricetes sp.]